MARDGQGDKAAKLWLRQQIRLGRRHQWPVVASGLLSILAASGQAVCAGRLLADALAPRTGAPPGYPAATLILCFASLGVARAALSFFSERAAWSAGAAARRRIRSDALGRLLHAGPSVLRGAHSGELAALVIDQVDALDGLFSRWAPAAVLAVLGPAVVACVVLFADPLAAFVLAVAGVFVPFGMAFAGIGAASASRRQFVALARLQARFVDRVRGIATIVLAGQATAEAGRLQTAADELRRRTMRVLRVAFLSSASLDLALAAALVLLAIRYGTGLARGTWSSPAAAMTVLLLVPEFFAPLRSFAAAYQDRLHAAGAAGPLATLPPLPAEPGPPARVRTVTASGVAVAFENVGLTWDPARGPALDGLSFRVPAGETLILAGPSGAGKSTAIEILLGFVRPDSGRVTINGADIAELVPQALARLTAWIGQRPVLFAGTIRDNIRFARPEASDREVEDAARSARVLEFANGLPDGLETRVGEGGYGLSGGQAQRVAVARAFLKNAPLLLLDEPTAHLDPATESEVLASLRRLAIGRTVILATHSAAAQAFGGGRRLDLRAGQAVSARGAA
ncbi:MAG: thiol reductant ABC exporter subunit CydD [Acetobacteraceae bacterium]|nr:thiol reductant ABC exporter subunit CydD [Acetobacteraceae bacterium]